jgi:ABC-type uncharacterized transport system permease subunit
MVQTTGKAPINQSKAAEMLANLANLGTPLLAIFTALIVASAVIFLAGSNPIQAHLALIAGAFGGLDSLSVTIIKSTPLLITGLGVAIAFRGGLFNIGVEGQLFVGSITAVIVGTALHAPTYIHLPLTLLVSALAGALWAAIPGFLKAKYAANEVITTLMTNYIAIRIITWSIGARGPLRAPSSVVPETQSIYNTARLPDLLPGVQLHDGVIYLELRAGPVTHAGPGFPVEAAVESMLAGLQEAEAKFGIYACRARLQGILRTYGHFQNFIYPQPDFSDRRSNDGQPASYSARYP